MASVDILNRLDSFVSLLFFVTFFVVAFSVDDCIVLVPKLLSSVVYMFAVYRVSTRRQCLPLEMCTFLLSSCRCNRLGNTAFSANYLIRTPIRLCRPTSPFHSP